MIAVLVGVRAGDLRRRARSCCCGPRSAPEYESGADVLLRSAPPTRCWRSATSCVQFLLGLHRRAFALVLALMAVPSRCCCIGAGDLDAFARTVLLVHATTAVVLLAMSLARDRPMTCGICSGPLRLRYRGDAPELAAAAFAPSCHSVSGYADLYACERCGTVQQPDLPTGAELHDLYRDMRDDAYLGRGGGPARAPSGACSTRSSATRRAGGCSRSAAGTACCSTRRAPAAGAVEGLELAAGSREHARSLGLDVRDQTLEEIEPAARYRRGRARRRARAPGRPGRRAAADRGACSRPGGVDADRHAGPGLAHGAARPARAGGATCRRTPT